MTSACAAHEREDAARSRFRDTVDLMPSSSSPDPGHGRIRVRRGSCVIGLVLIAAVSLTACSKGSMSDEDLERSDHWTKQVQDRWAGQPGLMASGSGVNDTTSRLSIGGGDGQQRKRIRVSIACEGHGTVDMAVWAGRFSDGRETGRQLAARSVQCGHDEDLYVATASEWITIGATSGDSSVGWFAAAYTNFETHTDRPSPIAYPAARGPRRTGTALRALGTAHAG